MRLDQTLLQLLEAADMPARLELAKPMSFSFAGRHPDMPPSPIEDERYVLADPAPQCILETILGRYAGMPLEPMVFTIGGGTHPGLHCHDESAGSFLVYFKTKKDRLVTSLTVIDQRDLSEME